MAVVRSSNEKGKTMPEHMNTTEIIQAEADYVLGTYARPPFVLVRGEGMYLYDSEGKAYLDFGSGIAVNALGHAAPDVVAAVREQVGELSHISNLYHSQPQAELANKLCQHSFADKVFFTNSGTEAMEAALKFARKYAQVKHGADKTQFVAFENGFHGRTFGSLSITAREKYQAPFRPLVPGALIAPFNDLDALEAAIGPQTCAVVLEPVQGEGGIHAASQEFMQAVRRFCDQYDALLIVDEIQSGMGRTGQLWAYQHYGIQPDMMTVAKALGGGLPIGAALLTEPVAAVMAVGDHGSTFAGGPVVCQAALAVLARISQADSLAHVRQMGETLQQKIQQLNKKSIQQIRGQGLMIGVELDSAAKDVMEKGYQHGLLLLSAGEKVLRLLPPLIVNQDDIDKFIQIFDNIID